MSHNQTPLLRPVTGITLVFFSPQVEQYYY